MDTFTILIADNDPVSLALLSKLVERLNHNVIRATTILEAIEALSNESVDLVIGNHDMPAFDGLNFLRSVKKEYPSLPFVFVTSSQDIKIIREAWQAGAFDFFNKPIFIDRLNQTIRLAIEYGHFSLARRKFPLIQPLDNDPGTLDMGVVRELAVSLDSDDLVSIVDEYEKHTKAELEHIFRLSDAKKFEEVRIAAHRLSTTSNDLGMSKFAHELRWIALDPDQPIKMREELVLLRDSSLSWVRKLLLQIYRDIA